MLVSHRLIKFAILRDLPIEVHLLTVAELSMFGSKTPFSRSLGVKSVTSFSRGKRRKINSVPGRGTAAGEQESSSFFYFLPATYKEAKAKLKYQKTGHHLRTQQQFPRIDHFFFKPIIDVNPDHRRRPKQHITCQLIQRNQSLTPRRRRVNSRPGIHSTWHSLDPAFNGSGVWAIQNPQALGVLATGDHKIWPFN